MLALTANGEKDIRVEEVDKPTLIDPGDALLRVTTSALCGSDLHVYHDKIPGMIPGTIVGHEFCGVVEDVADGVVEIKPGDRVVSSMYPSCGRCRACIAGEHRRCPAFGIFGFGEVFGGLQGGQSEYVRIPFADMTLVTIPEGLSDESTIFTGDILATAFTALRQAGASEGDSIAVVGAGPVGQLVAMCAPVFGASQVFVIDMVPDRLEEVKKYGAIPINVTEEDPFDVIFDATGNVGADIAVEAVGNPKSIETAFEVVRVGGTVSMVGVLIDEPWPISAGEAWLKGLKIVAIVGETFTYRDELLRLIANGRIDPAGIISDHMTLEQGPEAYRLFDERSVKKVVFDVSKI